MKGCEFSLICLFIVCYAVYCRSQTAGSNPCGKQGIPCENLDCIEKKLWCNDKIDCADGSDEKYCDKKGWFTYVDNECDTNQYFVCDNKMCVPTVVRCDGYNDCHDNSDEYQCDALEADGEVFVSNGNDTLNRHDSREDSTIEALPESTASRVYSTSAVPRPRSQRTTAPSIDHYDVRRSEGQDSQTQSVYHQNERNTRRYNRNSDTAPARDFFSNERRDSQNGQTPLHRNTGYHSPPDGLSHTSVSSSPRIPSTYWDPKGGIPNYPIIHRPRAVIYSQTQYRESTPVYNNKKKYIPLPPFHFEENYEHLRNRYERNIQKANQWLLEQRDGVFGWGKDTPRALVALSLIENSFSSNLDEYDTMKRRLRLDLGAKLLRSRKEPLSDSRLAMYINALLATCQDPREIFDQDLTEMLRDRTFTKTGKPVSPFIYITLCLTNSSVTHQDLNYLTYIVNSSITDEVSKDKFFLATSALACFQKSTIYGHELGYILDFAFRKLLQQQLDDGSFGSIYSTAIAAQALFAINSKSWDQEKTLDYLSTNQLRDGSFGDMLATYYVLPALSGRSLVHLRNTECETPPDDKTLEDEFSSWYLPGPKKSVLYSLAIGYNQRSSIALLLTVPVQANFFDIMRFAERLDPRFKFLYHNHSSALDVYTIFGIPNDPERGTYWNLYVLDTTDSTIDTSRIYVEDIRKLIPQDSQELLYWYLPFKPVFSSRK